MAELLKPIKPREPDINNYESKFIGDKNYLGQPIATRIGFIEDYKIWRIKMEQYLVDLEKYTQYTFIKEIKNNSVASSLKRFNIQKKSK